ncbi:MAG: type II toxin-antitoxin system RelE/ParE family toxin [Candidatus Cyclonatronum sp.]|uniref:type II toxin-antitoxin system RelE/ParE family toxin n=1 Tax=Cyclonatronum sp. TaxID=3024185 RepID=UPI0025BB935D|nr:type II toxin-antitoxin system RelE/ParE family toxin [Cyclonatronum sp.]MCH8485564.1 type II toxin-antitoxin system RelE/ParE family toxin [Cyclonatronum sp.]
MTFKYHPEAVNDLLSSAEYYESKSSGLGEVFIIEVERAIGLIIESPDSGSPVAFNNRMYLLKRFPFGIIYSTSGSTIKINAVMHLRRKPGFWKKRNL